MTNKLITIKGIVTDAELAAPLPGVNVSLKDENNCNKPLNVCTSNKLGCWQLNGVYKKQSLTFSLSGYHKKTFRVEELPEKVRLLADNLIGYQDKLWTLPGEKITAFINSPCDYKAVLFRHGLEKKSVFKIGNFSSQQQAIPDENFVEHGLKWDKSFEYQIPANSSPGIYSVLLTGSGQEKFAMPLLISSPTKKKGRKKKILVLASTNNWQTYNTWGGRSRYRNFEDAESADFIDSPRSLKQLLRHGIGLLLPEFIKDFIKENILGESNLPELWKFKALSRLRPFTNCALEGESPFEKFTNHLAGGEWRVLAWLEREGFDYDIISGYELHHNPWIVKDYKAIIFNTHCEYWSRAMYQAVKTAHQQFGTWIINLSGNTMFREVEFPNEQTIRCTSLYFEKSCEDESQLIGVRFSMKDYGSSAPYRVCKPQHWLFSGLKVSKKSVFGAKSLNCNTEQVSKRYDSGRPGLKNGLNGKGASGWETDKLTENAPEDFLIVAQGKNKQGGADMVIREPKALRGGVFSVSSITFGGSLLVDKVGSEACKTLIKNLLKIT